MAILSELQKETIKNHMLTEEDALKVKYKAKHNEFITKKVLHSEVEDWEKKGFIAGVPTKLKTPMSKKKDVGTKFEDDVWCMFYNLGFRVLNNDEKLRVQWGTGKEDSKQLDVVAVGEEAIFVVECKAAEKPRTKSFQLELNEIIQYKEGIANSLCQIYGKDKRVKFIFGTRNYRINEDSDDAVRMAKNGIYHLDDNAYNYITNLIGSYKESVIYQFYGLMFKDELISNVPITIPALRGHMGDKTYYLFSIEPSTLLKIGFVLHRTKVNDSMAPTYQRLLVPKRLKGITSFIDGGGYFPNSIIINFSDPNENIKAEFVPIHKEDGSDAQFGLLNIPNAYGIAYIIDGQHRVYGYANSDKKTQHTIPVVAFQNMPSEEQLKIFMEINENQKSVSKNLRIDLEEDLFWTSGRLDSRMKALRSSTIKMLCSQSSNVLYNMISIGEDQAELSSIPFDKGLLQSGLLPKAKQTKWIGDTDCCLYDTNETDPDKIDKAMKNSRKSITQLINACYEVAEDEMDDDIKSKFLFSNRATYPFIVIIGSIHAFLIHCGELCLTSTMSDRIGKIKPYISCLVNGLNSLSSEESTFLLGIMGQGAEKKWLLSYQNIINKNYPDYCPEDLKDWKEMLDQDLQAEGDNLKDEIRVLLRNSVFFILESVYGKKWESNVAKLENSCKGKIIDTYGDNDDFSMDDYDWKDWVEVSDYKAIIEKNFTIDKFSDAFSIQINDGPFKSKKEKLAWISIIEPQKGKKKNALTRSDVNRLWLIHDHLANFIPEEE